MATRFPFLERAVPSVDPYNKEVEDLSFPSTGSLMEEPEISSAPPLPPIAESLSLPESNNALPFDIPEAPLVEEPALAPSYKPLNLPTQDDFDRAEKASSDANLLINLNQAFSLIPASITGKQLPESLLASQRAMAGSPLERIQQAPKQAVAGMEANLASELNKVDSSASKMARQIALQWATMRKKSDPSFDIDNFKKDIENLTAAQLDQLGFSSRGSSLLNKPPGMQQTPYVNGKTGNPAVVLNNTLVDAITGEPVTSVLNRTVTTVTDAKTGDIIGLGVAGKEQQRMSSVVKPIAKEELEKNFTGPNAVQRKVLDNETDNFTKFSEAAAKQLSAARNLKRVLASNTALELGAVRTQMPKLAGEVGNLAAQEQEIWSGSMALEDRLEQFISTIREGRLSDSNRKELMKALNAFQLAAEDALLMHKNAIVKRLELANIPESYSTKVLPTYGVEPRIRVKNIKTGQVFRIPASKAKKYLDKKDEYQLADKAK